MTQTNETTPVDRGFAVGGALRSLILLAAVVTLGACDIEELVEVPDPDVVTRDVFANPENFDAVYAGVVREFARAYGGTQNAEGGQVLFSGLLADEFYHSGTFTTRSEVDARNTTRRNDSNTEAFFWLQRARNHGEIAADLFADSDRAGNDQHAEILALVGYTYVMFGENYCSGVPFSTLPLEGDPEFGGPESTAAIFGRAIDAFEASLALNPGTELQHLADLGIARAQVNLDNHSDAASRVSGIPTEFEWNVAYSSSVTDAWNAVWQLTNAEKRWSAAGSEGGNGLPFLTTTDPRISTSFTGDGFDETIDHYAQGKYSGAGSPIPLATGIEARLIEAEAALGTDRSDFFQIHTDLRAAFGMDPLTDSGQSQEELVDLHFQERAYWLWLTSHRLGDLRRLVRQYGRAPETVYPAGPTVRGLARGDHVALPVPFDETNNPEFESSMCDPTVP